MGFFSKNIDSFPWIFIKEIEEFNNIWESDNVFLIFKHSTRCSISSMALRNFENEFVNIDKCMFFLLDLIQYRNLSNYISNITDITHQSPQVLLVKNKQILYSASHENISANEIEKILL